MLLSGAVDKKVHQEHSFPYLYASEGKGMAAVGEVIGRLPVILVGNH